MIIIETSHYTKPYIFGMKDNNSGIFSLLWIPFSIFSRLNLIITPILNIFQEISIYKIKSTDNSLIVIMLYISILISGLILNYSIFIRGNQKFLWPEKYIRESYLESMNMFFCLNSAYLIAYIASFYINEINNKIENIDRNLIIFLIITTSIFIINKIIILMKKDIELSFYDSYKSINQSIDKINSKLNESDKNELNEIIEKEYSYKKSFMSHVGEVLFIGISLSLVIQIIQTILAPSIRGLLG